VKALKAQSPAVLKRIAETNILDFLGLKGIPASNTGRKPRA
jgi:hypothetical protein